MNDDWLSQEDFKKEYSNFHFQRFVPSARFTRHHYDAEIVDKLQDIIDNATEDEIETSRMQGCSGQLHLLRLSLRSAELGLFPLIPLCIDPLLKTRKS